MLDHPATITENGHKYTITNFSFDQRQYEVAERLTQEGVGIYANIEYPENWRSLDINTKLALVQTHRFHSYVDHVYLNRRERLATDDDLKLITILSEHNLLWIDSPSVTIQGLRHLTELKKLDTLLLYSENATDELYPIIMNIPLLQTLDVKISKISNKCIR